MKQLLRVHPARLRRALALVVLSSVSLGCMQAGATPPSALSGPPWRVVILHGADGTLPANAQAGTAFRQVVAARDETRVEIFSEDLDTLRYPAEELDRELVALLKRKHSARPPHVVVAFSRNALEFAERHHENLWPHAVLVFMAIDEKAIAAVRGAHAATGVLSRRQTAKTVELGLTLLPRTKRVVLVSGASVFDRETMAVARADVARFADKVQLEFIENVPFADALARIAQLPADSLLLPISIFRDSTGRSFVPSDAVARMAQASPVPTLTLIGTPIGRQVLGGHVVGFADQGREAGRLVLEILAGGDARAMPVRAADSGCVLDWRELRRWQIPMSRAPADCDVRYREYSYWEQHLGTVTAIAAVILFQAFLIFYLILQHRQRRRAESEAQKRRSQLAHAARLATVGELTASIAHEINQPLGAILSNSDAAEILLESPNPDLGEIRQILADIRRDDERASAVIQRLRALLARHELERVRLDTNGVVREAIALISQEAERRGTRIVESLSGSVPDVDGDRVHLVQVMIILIMNALDAMEFAPSGRRQVVITAAQVDGMAQIGVRDAGPGIRTEDFSRLFDSFFTTKATGMGLGLSIARSIVEAHGGMIWAENPAGGGAMFHFRLPRAK